MGLQAADICSLRCFASEEAFYAQYENVVFGNADAF